jgi:hypothetical protein
MRSLDSKRVGQEDARREFVSKSGSGGGAGVPLNLRRRVSKALVVSGGFVTMR